MLPKSHIFTLVSSFIIIISLIGFAQATSTYFTVKTGEEVSRSIDLAKDDRVQIKYSVSWAAEASTVDFSLVTPNGTITEFGEQGTFSFSFVCTEAGQYTMHFVNHNPNATPLVTLEYKIDHYLLGMTTDFFWLVFIALVCIVGIVGFVILSKTS